VDPVDGSLKRIFEPPIMGPPGTETGLIGSAADSDGTLWLVLKGPLAQRALCHTDGKKTLSLNDVEAGDNGATYHVRVDAAGRILLVSLNNPAGGTGSRIIRYLPDGTIDAQFQFGGPIWGFALGPTGEDIFAVVAPFGALMTRRLERLNTITGKRSSVLLDPTWFGCEMAYGDTTGFILATVIDQQGDGDGDGAAIREETLAGSNPFDASSRPEGPKVRISFTASNALVLTHSDPDGLLHPQGGLDVPALSLTAGSFGEIFPVLLPFLTFVQVEPDLSQATAVFGALPFASGAKIPFEARVTDLTGATGWDFQVSPPGEL
jgi:hypothetical protein